MTFLVTGVAGFIGSHILYDLLKRGHKVIGIDNYSTGSPTNIARALIDSSPNQFEFYMADICDLEEMLEIFHSQPIDVVIHQAALGSVPRSFKDPRATYRANVDGFLNVIDATKQLNIRRFVYASSSSVYGDDALGSKYENLTGTPLSPYAATKTIDEQIASNYTRCFGMQTIGLRYFNVFGERQNPNGPYAAVIPKWIEAIKNRKPIEIYGDGTIARDFTYIKNVVQANWLAATTNNPPALNQVYNIGCGESTTLNALFGLLLKNLNVNATEVRVTNLPAREGDIQNSKAKISKARELLGYNPEFNLRAGLADYLIPEPTQSFDDITGIAV